MQQQRKVLSQFKGVAAMDGAGVKLTRIIGSPYLNLLDPFLLLDAFSSDKSQDYIAGFPPHPHRGFETVTYMLAGKMRHQDSAGNSGVIETGGVQWMTAGRGIIHSEMPEQEDGLLAGFQLWVNLPAAEKMTAPKYQERSAQEIAVDNHIAGVSIKVIAGTTSSGVEGVIENPWTQPIYWDITQTLGTQFLAQLPAQHNAFIYVISGALWVGESEQVVEPQAIAVLSLGENVQINATENARYLLIAGKPLKELIARGGPFVMNTREQINQAFYDYQTGHFA